MAQRPPQSRTRQDWSSDFPEPDVLKSIGKLLSSGHDAGAFRSVCSPWRAAMPFKSFEPLLLLPFGPESRSIVFYSVSEEETFSVPLPDDVRGKVLCGASRGWLALMDEAASVTLLNPFTGVRVDLPPADEHVAAASSTSVSKVNGRWVLHRDHGNGNTEADSVIKLDQMRDIFFHEIVLSPPPYASRGCLAMAVLPNSTKVAFCRVGSDTAWTLLETNLECSVDCIVHCQEKIFAVDATGDISICKCSEEAGAGAAAPTATPLPSLSPPADVCNRSYVGKNGELYLVGVLVTTFDETMSFSYSTVVYKCDFLPVHQTPVWSKVDNVGDQTVLVSKGFRENFSGASVSNYKRNSVYFSEALYGGPTKALVQYEVINIATDASEVVGRFHGKMVQPDALCWFRPNIWMGGGLSKSKDDEEKSSKEAEPSKIQRIT